MSLGIAVGIGHGEKMGPQLPVVPVHGEALLVVPQGGDEEFQRQLEEILLERPGHDARPLHEIRHLVQERLVLDDRPTQLTGGSLEFLR